MSQVIPINQLVDEQKIGWFNIKVLFWCFLAMFADGFDITAMSFAAPELSRLWTIDPAAFGPVFSASLFGILFGAPLLGFVGDRYGRKVTIISGCLIYGFSTLAVIWASSLDQIFVLRFITGIGIGGLMPNTIALNAELSPKRFRARLIVLMFMGVTLGSSTPGFVSAWLMPAYGWQVIFLLGGLIPILIALCLLFVLPESVKYLATQPRRHAQLVRTARIMRPDLSIAGDTSFVNPLEMATDISSTRDLFKGGLALITPLLWICFATSLMANYFLNSWMPLLFENNGIPADEAALTSSLYHLGGTFGGLLISMLLDRFGFAIIALLFVIAGPAIAMVGSEGLSHGGLAFFAALSGFAVLGSQFGNNASAGLLYPTNCRSKGVGLALAIARFGAIIGPLAGGILIGMGLPMQTLFVAAAIPMVIGVIAASLLARICYKRFDGFQLDDIPALPKTVQAPA
ncbi:MAG: MFS transporter [Pseudomonadales bacterium]|nr:MFS transporter [Pseudomonadales bacterium]